MACIISSISRPLHCHGLCFAEKAVFSLETLATFSMKVSCHLIHLDHHCKGNFQRLDSKIVFLALLLLVVIMN